MALPLDSAPIIQTGGEERQKKSEEGNQINLPTFKMIFLKVSTSKFPISLLGYNWIT